MFMMPIKEDKWSWRLNGVVTLKLAQISSDFVFLTEDAFHAFLEVCSLTSELRFRLMIFLTGSNRFFFGADDDDLLPRDRADDFLGDWWRQLVEMKVRVERGERSAARIGAFTNDNTGCRSKSQSKFHVGYWFLDTSAGNKHVARVENNFLTVF